MDPSRIDLNCRSSEISQIPYDVTFKFRGLNGATEEVAAHKMILAMVSKIFRNMFVVNNTLDKSISEIFMEDTTMPPFEIMIDAIYNTIPMKKNLHERSLDEIFAVLYLVNKYEIPELTMAAKECISFFPITGSRWRCESRWRCYDLPKSFHIAPVKDPTHIDLNGRSVLISEIPPDVTFKFRAVNGAVGEVGGHKMILAMVSKIFRKMFFSSETLDKTAVMEDSIMQSSEFLMEDMIKPSSETGMEDNTMSPSGIPMEDSALPPGEIVKEVSNLPTGDIVMEDSAMPPGEIDEKDSAMPPDEIEMEDTTMAPFEIMIDAIYNTKPMKENLQDRYLDEIFDVLYLVTKYEIPELELAVKEYISSFPITTDNVLEVAEDAMIHSSGFAETVHNLLLRCARFLKSKLTDADSVLRFVADNGENNAVVYKLVVLMKDLPPVSCSNCQRSPCQDEAEVESSKLREGLKVAHNPNVQRKHKGDNCGIWVHTIKHYTGKVLRVVDDFKVEVKYSYKLQGSSELKSGIDVYTKDYDGKCIFIFRCK